MAAHKLKDRLGRINIFELHDKILGEHSEQDAKDFIILSLHETMMKNNVESNEAWDILESVYGIIEVEVTE